ncbi:MAG: LamG domain-containing protein [Polyangiaceae bacterium]
MSPTNHSHPTAARLSTWLIGAALVTACSLTVPSESSLFGGSTGGGGKGGESGATEDAGKSGGGNPRGGAPEGGAAGSGSPEAGAGNETTSGGRNVGGAAEMGGGAEMGGEPGEGGAAGEPGVIVLPPAVLIVHYDFDDLSGLVAKDVSGNGKDGTLAGSSLPVGVAGHIGGAISLSGAQKQYVQLPNDILQGRNGVSVASWLKLSQALAWDRLFDFNAGESEWFFFSPTGWNDNTKTFGTRCATRTTSALAPEIMMTMTISINTWHHVAVVFAKPFLRYYLDGVMQAEQTEVMFGPDSLGDTNQNWIGRSVYATDPYLSGQVDDFRLYSGALTSTQVADLASM